MVAGTTGQLCEAANALVQGGASEEKLVAAAMGVSKSTAQLLLACMVKADPHSDSAKRLQVGLPFHLVESCRDCTLPLYALCLARLEPLPPVTNEKKAS